MHVEVTLAQTEAAEEAEQTMQQVVAEVAEMETVDRIVVRMTEETEDLQRARTSTEPHTAEAEAAVGSLALAAAEEAEPVTA